MDEPFPRAAPLNFRLGGGVGFLDRAEQAACPALFSFPAIFRLWSESRDLPSTALNRQTIDNLMKESSIRDTLALLEGCSVACNLSRKPEDPDSNQTNAGICNSPPTAQPGVELSYVFGGRCFRRGLLSGASRNDEGRGNLVTAGARSSSSLCGASFA